MPAVWRARRPGQAGPMPHRRPWSELSLLICAAIALLIAAAVASTFGASQAWLLVAVLGGAYAVSRGASRNDWPAEGAEPLRIRATLPARERDDETAETAETVETAEVVAAAE